MPAIIIAFVFLRGLVNFHFHVGVLEIDGCVGAAVIDFAISYLLSMKTSYIIYKDSKDPDLSEIMANGIKTRFEVYGELKLINVHPNDIYRRQAPSGVQCNGAVLK
ncbi:hypothetical protein T09_10998 [Trichinella sp. T9]|nr:hypothetical protein T09_10998 [Trichinella sp. T9]KRZ97998.1 hypothetical protein T08_8580 [Trichinella sp. T8]